MHLFAYNMELIQLSIALYARMCKDFVPGWGRYEILTFDANIGLISTQTINTYTKNNHTSGFFALTFCNCEKYEN